MFLDAMKPVKGMTRGVEIAVALHVPHLGKLLVVEFLHRQELRVKAATAVDLQGVDVRLVRSEVLGATFNRSLTELGAGKAMTTFKVRIVNAIERVPCPQQRRWVAPDGHLHVRREDAKAPVNGQGLGSAIVAVDTVVKANVQEPRRELPQGVERYKALEREFLPSPEVSGFKS